MRLWDLVLDEHRHLEFGRYLYATGRVHDFDEVDAAGHRLPDPDIARGERPTRDQRLWALRRGPP